MPLEVEIFSPVEELVAVTVAPGIGVLPDLTNPEIENEGSGGVSCAIKPAAMKNSSMKLRTTVILVEVDDVRTLAPRIVRPFMRMRT